MLKHLFDGVSAVCSGSIARIDRRRVATVRLRHEAGRAQGHDDGYDKCRRKGAGHGLDRRGDGEPHRLAERGGQVEDAEILAGLLLSLPTSISQTAVVRKRRPFLGLRRPEWYA